MDYRTQRGDHLPGTTDRKRDPLLHMSVIRNEKKRLIVYRPGDGQDAALFVRQNRMNIAPPQRLVHAASHVKPLDESCKIIA